MSDAGSAIRKEPRDGGPGRSRGGSRPGPARSIAIPIGPGHLWHLTMAQAVASLGALAAIALMISAPDLPRPGPMEAMAVLVLFLVLWITKTVPEHLAAIIFFIAAVAVLGVPSDIALSGFHSGAVWLVLGGLLVGVAIKSTGLGERLARAMLSRTTASYHTLIIGAVGAGLLLAFVSPSAVGRVMVLLPVVVAVADRLGFKPGDPGRSGLIVAAALGTMIPAYAILPSIIPNITMLGAAQTLYGVEFSYGEYMLANFPVLGMGSLILLPLLIVKLFPDRPRPPIEAVEMVAPSIDEKRLIAILVAALVLWITDSWHGISPAWVALGAGVLCLMPGIGPAREVPFPQGVNIGAWLLIAAIISLGAVINYCGLGEALGAWLVDLFELKRGETVWNFSALTLIGMGVSTVTTAIGAPTIMTPLAQQFATATGWPIEGVLMAQVPTWFFFPQPYQMPILIIAMTIGKVPVWPVTRLLMVFTVLGLSLVLPLHFLWLQVLGYLP